MAFAYAPLSDWFIARFSRVTRSGEIIREVDGFRFIAIAAVAFHHLLANVLEAVYRIEVPAGGWQGLKQTHYMVWLLSPTWFGVQLFFVISGFVLGLPFARHHRFGDAAPNLQAYYWRRLTRIEPPYVIALAVYMLFLSIGDPAWRERLPNFFASLFYMHNLIYGQMTRIGSIFWSLEIEVQFYLIAPLLAQIFTIRADLLRRASLIGLVAAWGYAAPRGVCVYSDRASLSILCSLQYFLAGFLLIEIYLSERLRSSLKNYRWDGIALCAAAALGVLLLKFWHGWWLLPFLIVLLYVSLFLGKIGNRFVTHPVVYILGGMCYTIYLYHALVIANVGRHATFLFSSASQPLMLNLLWQTILLAPFILVICAVLFRLCEKPFMQLRIRA